MPITKPEVQLTDGSGNAFFILGKVKKALLKAGYDKEYIHQYLREAMSGDYGPLLQVTMKYVEVK